MAREAQFLLDQYKCLRDEIIQQKKTFVELARNAILGSAGVIAWLVASDLHQLHPTMRYLAWWLPFALCLLSSLQVMNNHFEMHTLARHLKAIEREFCAGKTATIGWEHFKERRENNSVFKINTLALPAFWLLILLATAWVGWLGSTTL